MRIFHIGAILLTVAAIFAGACAKQGTVTPPTPPVVYSVPELKYKLIANFGDVFYVDTDFYPVAREGQEEKNALEQFPAIKADNAEFTAILQHLSLPDKADYTTEEKVNIYREHKKLTRGIEMTASGDIYNFVLRIGEGQGERIEGTITTSGKIVVTKREKSFNTYPICLARGTLIATPGGQVPVEQIKTGMFVWSVDSSGQRVAIRVERTVVTPVPPFFQVVRVILNDGRSVTASPGHPAADGWGLGNYAAGDILDGATVVSVERVNYDGGATYDILPAGTTGMYWANDVLLMSTLAGK
ncbi:MAG: Hint domain-containing protein [Dehalococcoidales bacterium]|nr:Hint domain-containing protein [Dehalococcoidales bacterium]